jgi:hypothetical protein
MLWRLYSHGQDRLFCFFSDAARTVPYKTALVDPSFSRCQVFLSPDLVANGASVDPLEYPLDELLVIHRLALDSGCELHSCSVINDDGEAMAFAGQSGDGKTTLAKLWAEVPGFEVVSDDRTIVRRNGSGVRLYGTPWHGEGRFASPRAGQLTAVFILEKGSHTEIVPLARTQAVALLMARAFTTFYDAQVTARLLAFLETVVTDVPCALLRFRPESEAIDMVRRRRKKA